MGPRFADSSAGSSYASIRLGAVVLAAGASSRMGGTVKALASLGPVSVLERVVATLNDAGVVDTVVVTGYHEARLGPEVARLEVREAHNPQPDRGMFSSVRTGVDALFSAIDHPPALDGFFILPVDYALVRPSALRASVRALTESPADVVHPCCAGQRGHPPLLSARLQPDLAATDDADLRAFLSDARLRSLEVETEDLTVLMDLHPGGYRLDHSAIPSELVESSLLPGHESFRPVFHNHLVGQIDQFRLSDMG